MSSDKLSVAARAAGFAMAYDEAPIGVGPKALPGTPPQLTPQLPALRQEPQVRPAEMIVGSLARSNAAWGLGGWTFWKTA